jgi:hypothetical protein
MRACASDMISSEKVVEMYAKKFGDSSAFVTSRSTEKLLEGRNGREKSYLQNDSLTLCRLIFVNVLCRQPLVDDVEHLAAQI